MSPCRSRQDHAVNRNGILTSSINKWRHQRNKYFLSIENQMFSMLKKTNFWPNPAAGFLPEWLICNNSLVHYRQNQQNMSLPNQFVPYVRQKKTFNFFFMLQFFGSHELFLFSWISYHLMGMNQLEPPCCKKRPKKYQYQETGLGNRGHLKVLKDTKIIKGVIHVYLGPIWYHSEPSDIPYSPNQFLGWDIFLPFLTARQL